MAFGDKRRTAVRHCDLVSFVVNGDGHNEPRKVIDQLLGRLIGLLKFALEISKDELEISVYSPEEP